MYYLLDAKETKYPTKMHMTFLSVAGEKKKKNSGWIESIVKNSIMSVSFLLLVIFFLWISLTIIKIYVLSVLPFSSFL